MYAIGIDVGGTSIKWGVVSNEGKVLCQDFIPTYKDYSKEQMVETLCEKILLFLKNNNYDIKDFVGVGMGCPGTVDSKKGHIIHTPNMNWSDFDIVKLMNKKLGLPTYVTNDANAAALGEITFGVAKNYSTAIMLTLGTGVGGGIVIDNKLFEGNMGTGAELGHMVIDIESDVQCGCGRYGCLEAHASATALIREAKKALENNRDSVLWELVDHEIDKVNGKNIFDAYHMGDKAIIEVVNNYIKYLSHGIMNYCNIFRPEAVILSGGIAKQGKVLVDLINDYCSKWNFGFKNSPKVEILIAELGYESGIVGSAALAFQK